MKVLLVEPDKVLSETTQLALRAFGIDVTVKTSAQTALDALDETVPDLIILEIQLGLHNGIEFLYEIRSYPEWQNIPVIIHSINHKVLDDIFASSLSQLGVQRVLYKPRTTIKQLVRIVKDSTVTV